MSDHSASPKVLARGQKVGLEDEKEALDVKEELGRSGSSASSRSRSRSSKSGSPEPRRKSKSRSRRRSHSRSRSDSRSPSPVRKRRRSRSKSRSRSRSRSSRRTSSSYRRSPEVGGYGGGYSRRGYGGGGYGGPRGGGRVAQDSAPPSRCVGVFGMSLYTTERDLEDFFSKFGRVESVQLVYDHPTGRSRGFGFVYFDNIDDAVEAKERAPGTELDGHRIRVDFSATKRAHTPTPGIYMGNPNARSRGGYERGRGDYDRGGYDGHRRDDYRGGRDDYEERRYGHDALSPRRSPPRSRRSYSRSPVRGDPGRIHDGY